jgi:phenylacetaldehyde dehydrogenase
LSIHIQKPEISAELRALLAKPKRLLIDGKWVDARSGKTFAVEDPATQETITHVAEGDAADVDLAVAAARQAFESGPWARMLPAERASLVWRLDDLLEKHADELAQLEALDNGKPMTAARSADVVGSIAMFCYMSGRATRLAGETIPVSSPGEWHTYTLREPVGVVGQIIP